jgi:hypothetical protein
MRIIRWLVAPALMVALGLAVRAADKEAEAKQAKEDVAAFKTYLEKNKPGKKWQNGPTRIDSEEVRKVYSDKRFYYVFSAAPLPPGANLPNLIKSYQEKLKDFRENYISLTVAVDDKGKVAPVDYNAGLTPPKTEADVKLAAAAILTLHAEGVAPAPVAVKDVQVSKTDKGWTCTAGGPKVSFAGQVTFDPDGKVLNVSKQYAGPFPP